MKKLLRSFTSFTRTERMGLVGLCGLLVVLMAIRATMHLWAHPATDPEKNKQLVAAWETFKRSHPAIKTTDTGSSKNDYQDAFDDNEAPLPAIVNINTADSATLVRFKGIGPATAGKIIARRKAKGPYTSVNQLLEIRSFPEATFKILKAHLSIAPVPAN